MRANQIKIVLISLLAFGIGGCGTAPYGTSTAESIPVTNTTTSSASGYGVIQSIDIVSRNQPRIGLGTVAGAVVGGALGNQIGSGSGRTVATVAGVAGGAMVGNKMENKGSTPDQSYRVVVRMDNGSIQTLVQDSSPGVQIGERVRLSNGAIVERFR